MSGKIRIIQYGVGPIGAAIVRLMLQKPQLQIVGAIDVDPAKVGQDLGVTVGCGRELGVKISNDADAVLAGGADVAVHTTSSYLHQVSEQLKRCLNAGVGVVSTCEELAYPFRKHPQLSRELDRLAQQKRVAVLGTGVNPGFAMDKLALTLAAACQSVSQVRVRRIVDAARRRLPLQQKVGAGLTPEEFRALVAKGEIKHHGLPESTAMIADSLGIAVDDIRETIEPVIAAAEVRSEFLEVAKGHVAGVRQVARGLSSGNENIYLELEMYLGAPATLDSISISGVPKLELTIAGGIHGDLATAAITVNCIPEILSARPGLRTSRDIPMCYYSGLPEMGSSR